MWNRIKNRMCKRAFCSILREERHPPNHGSQNILGCAQRLNCTSDKSWESVFFSFSWFLLDAVTITLTSTQNECISPTSWEEHRSFIWSYNDMVACSKLCWFSVNFSCKHRSTLSQVWNNDEVPQATKQIQYTMCKENALVEISWT